jgi:hypothetical protein
LRKSVVLALAIGAAAFQSPRAAKVQKVDIEAACEDVLAKSTRRVISSEHFEVVSDSANPSAASILASNLESVFHAMAEMLPAPAGLARPGKVHAYLFQYEAQYKRLMTFAQGGDNRVYSVGMYVPSADVLVFHMETPNQEELQHTMIHEGAHAYVDRVLCAPDVGLPTSLNEGLAEYVAHSRVEQGRIQPGSYADTVAGARSIASYRLTAAQVAARDRKGALSFDFLLGFAPTHVRIARDEFYGVSWLLVDFLRHGRPGWSRDALPKFLVRVGAGVPTRKALEEAYGVPAAELEAEFRRYVNAFQLPTTRTE